MESPVEDVKASGDGKAISRRRPRFLCLHGFRASGEIMRTEVVGAWPADVIARLDLVFANGSFPAEGKSSLEGIFPPPYFEWYNGEPCMNYRNIDKCLEYIEELMIKDGPFDGLMGFSQVNRDGGDALGGVARSASDGNGVNEGSEGEVCGDHVRGEISATGGGRRRTRPRSSANRSTS